ncbi:MAG TPA: RNA polymerase sigma factor [Acidimicrobiales bacterium]|nr:RNA polymerase sigma factor [Acidimicrobiales bacterium]
MGFDRVDARTDAELLADIVDGRRGGLEELYARHAGWLTLRLTRRCGDPDVVDLAVQDTFVAVWNKPGSFKATGEVAAWIWGIGVRRLIDQLRRQPSARATRWRDEMQVSAEDEVLLGIEHGDLPRAIDGLSPELRLVVQATVLDGLTTREAGRLLGIPTGTVKTRMARARAQMREALA